MWLFRIAVYLSVALFLAGCGFKPLYGNREGSILLQELASIELAPLRGIIGVQLHNTLHDNLRPNPDRARYYLSIEYDKANYALITAKDSQIRRYTMILTVRYRLTEIVSKTQVKNGHTSAQASYSVIEDNAYATFIAEEEASLRAAKQVGYQLTNILSFHFSDDNKSP